MLAQNRDVLLFGGPDPLHRPPPFEAGLQVEENTQWQFTAQQRLEHGRIKLQHLQERYSDQILTMLTILLVLLMFVLAPLYATGSVVAQERAVLVALALIAGAATISGSVIAVAEMAFGLHVNHGFDG